MRLTITDVDRKYALAEINDIDAPQQLHDVFIDAYARVCFVSIRHCVSL